MFVYIMIVISVISFIIFSEEVKVDKIDLYIIYLKKEENILNVSLVSNITFGIFTSCITEVSYGFQDLIDGMHGIWQGKKNINGLLRDNVKRSMSYTNVRTMFFINTTVTL